MKVYLLELSGHGINMHNEYLSDGAGTYSDNNKSFGYGWGSCNCSGDGTGSGRGWGKTIAK